MKTVLLIATAFLSIGATCAQPAADSETVVYINAKVFTANAKSDVAEAFAVKDGHFVAVGTRATMQPFVKAGGRVVDLHGQFVMPGITDDHFHGTGGGNGVALANVRSMEELVGALRDAAAKVSPGTIVITNGDWHEAQLKEQRKPTTVDLDMASTTVPIIVVRGGHSIFLNSVALAQFGISGATVPPAGGSIERTPDGKLTGELVDKAKALVPLPPEPPLTEQDLIDTQREMNSYGVTSVRIPGSFRKGAILDIVEMARAMESKGKLTLRYTVLRPGPGFAGGTMEALKTGPQQGDGDDWVRIDGVKLMVDGGFEGAHFTAPYAEPYGKNGAYSGITVIPPAQTTADVRALHKMGWNIAIPPVALPVKPCAFDVEKGHQAFASANSSRVMGTRSNAGEGLGSIFDITWFPLAGVAPGDRQDRSLEDHRCRSSHVVDVDDLMNVVVLRVHGWCPP